MLICKRFADYWKDILYKSWKDSTVRPPDKSSVKMKIGIEHRWMILRGDDKTFFPVTLRQDSGSWPPLTGFRDYTHWTNHTRYDSSGGEISPTQKPSTCTTHNTHNRQTSMPQEEFEVAIPESERPQTHALDGPDTGNGG